MVYIFEIIDKTGRKIYLTKERWKHIQRDHPTITEEEIKISLITPLKIVEKRNDKYLYFQYFKYKPLPFRHLKVVVKYLNGHGFVITSHLVKHIT